MSFPPSVQQVTVSAGAAGYHAPDGSPCVGTIRFTPSVPRVVSAEHGVIALGPVNATLSASGMFTAALLAVDAEGFEPSGWTYRVDEEFINAPGRAWNVSLPAAAPVVDLPSLSPVSSSSGTVQETGAAAALAIHSADTTNVHGIADTSVLETQSGAQSKADSAQSAATTAAAGDATAKVGDHASATDPHGDRAWADNKFATQLDLSTLNGSVNSLSSTVTAIDGFLNDALTRVSAIEQGTAYLAGGHFTGPVEVIDAELTVRTASGDVGRLRPTPWLFDVTDPAYGAQGDAKVIADGAMTAGAAVLTSASNPFANVIPGMKVSVKNAGATGVTTLIADVVSKQNDGQITLSATNASGGNVTGAVVIFGTDDTAAIQAAVDAAEAYLTAGHVYAQVHFPPRPYIVAGPLSSAKSGSGQIVFGVYSTAGGKKILEFRGETDGAAAVRHWQQTIPQFAGSCLISLGVFASTSAQIASINAHGNPAVISGPNEGSGYGAAALYSNVMPVLKNLAILTTHSAYGLTYGAATLWGCANAHVENVGYGTAGVVTGSDYASPGTFGTGLSVGFLLPAPGNNDHVIAKNISCGGGYTYAMFMTEHTVMDRYMALYCWAGLCAVGNYAGSVGSVHAMKVISASVEACTHELYIVGVGSGGVGPIVDIDQLSTESSTPNIAGNSAGAMAGALGRIKLTGLFTETGVSVSNPTGIEIVNGQVPRAIKRKTSGFTCSPIDRVLVCDTSSGGFTGTLPDAAFCPTEYTFKNIGAFPLTVAAAGGQLIYASSGTGAATATVPTGQTLRVQALFNGSAWGWYAIGQPSVDLTSDQTIAGNKTFSYYTVLEGGQVNGEFHLLGTAAFFGATPVGRQTVAGAKGGNTALASLITALANLGLVTDTTTA